MGDQDVSGLTCLITKRPQLTDTKKIPITCILYKIIITKKVPLSSINIANDSVQILFQNEVLRRIAEEVFKKHIYTD